MKILSTAFLMILFLSSYSYIEANVIQGSLVAPFVDSDMSEQQAFALLNLDCPAEIRNRQRLVKVYYYSFDRKVHQGQIIVDARLTDDIKQIFHVAIVNSFQIQSVIPLADRRFVVDGAWSDDVSMELNNTSAFNYRAVTGGKKLSNHSYGFAIDINPKLNPYIKGKKILPPGAEYDPTQSGTLTEEHPVVKKFLELGWSWGGHWESLKDYQHFEKVLKED